MLVYENTKAGFLDDALEAQLVPKIKQGYQSQGLGMGSPGEVRSWKTPCSTCHAF